MYFYTLYILLYKLLKVAKVDGSNLESHLMKTYMNAD